jgi:hypothetical protein
MGGRDEQDKLIVRSVDGKGEHFEDVLEQHLSRRSFLKSRRSHIRAGSRRHSNGWCRYG